MDLEHLTKHQIVLLTLLVSFVTSIATGIVTVSLVNQAPPGITRTINQIVEHTVERVVPAAEGTAAVAAAPATVTERTIVVKDDDLAAQSIAKVQKSVARIVARGGTLLITRALITSAGGTAIADRAALAASGVRNVEAILADGNRYPVTVRPATRDQAVAVLDIDVGTSSAFSPAPLSDSAKVQLGQSVIRIGGTGSDSVATGVAASLPDQAHPGLLEASVTSQTPGAVLITMFGEVVGISTGASRALGAGFYSIPSLPPAASS